VLTQNAKDGATNAKIFVVNDDEVYLDDIKVKLNSNINALISSPPMSSSQFYYNLLLKLQDGTIAQVDTEN
jgi:hypothetical protein